jgi:4-alpha-glucanotransferase
VPIATEPDVPGPLDRTLLELADAHGVATELWDWGGVPIQVSHSTIVAVLSSLGVDAATPAAIREALDGHRHAQWRRVLPPCVVIREGWTPWIRVHIPHGDPVRLWIELETGEQRYDVTQRDVYVDPLVIAGTLTGEATFEVPGDLPLGWHRLCAGPTSGGRIVADCPLVVAPERCKPPFPDGTSGWGWMTQLYAVRSRRSWGIGDTTDLAAIADSSARRSGADFLLVNPVHAADPTTDMEASPYLPTSRRYRHPIYLHVEEIPELSHLDPQNRETVAQLGAKLRAHNSDNGPIDWGSVWAAKSTALSMVYEVPRSPYRQAAFEAFVNNEGRALDDFATWCALAEVHGRDGTRWPHPLRDPASPAVSRARDELSHRVGYFRWLQWILDEQLASVQRVALEAGMSIGIIHDLAVGVHPCGADAWVLRELLATGVSVGAPADAFNQQGQDWTEPPWHPARLAEAGYVPYRQMITAVLRHGGGLRIDHIVGLFRLWWVPKGMSPAEGTYVRYDHEALVSILLLEAHRAGAVLIGEDLGTVEPWVRDYLADRGILGTSIAWFESGADDLPLPPDRWRRACLATVTTHDLPPTAGYLMAEHVALRHRLGLLNRPMEMERALAEEERDRWLTMLRSCGFLGEIPTVADHLREITEALHRFVAATSSLLRGVALTDATGDRRAVNQPGTDTEYPNWRLPLTDDAGRVVLLEELLTAERTLSLSRIIQGATVPQGATVRGPR